MKKVLVIGATGLLGNALMRTGKGKYELYGTYNGHPIKEPNFFQLDVTKRQETFKLIEKIKPDLVVDTHALHNVDYCETHPEEAWLVNVEGTKNAAESSKRAGAKYIFVSTDYVFDGKKSEFAEKDKPNPPNYYAKTKWAAEMVLEALGINHIVVRTSVLYGAGGLGKQNFAVWLINKLKNNEQVNIVSDQHNNPTLVDSLAEIIFKLFELDEKRIFHVTGKDCMSRYEFSKAIAKKFKLNEKLISSVTTPQLNQVAMRAEKINMNTNKVERITGIKTLTIEEGLDMLKKQLNA